MSMFTSPTQSKKRRLTQDMDAASRSSLKQRVGGRQGLARRTNQTEAPALPMFKPCNFIAVINNTETKVEKLTRSCSVDVRSTFSPINSPVSSPDPSSPYSAIGIDWYAEITSLTDVESLDDPSDELSFAASPRDSVVVPAQVQGGGWTYGDGGKKANGLEGYYRGLSQEHKDYLGALFFGKLKASAGQRVLYNTMLMDANKPTPHPSWREVRAFHSAHSSKGKLATIVATVDHGNLTVKPTGKKKTSKLMGVSWDKRGKWRADLQIKGKKRFLGYFTEELAAARAYQNAAASSVFSV